MGMNEESILVKFLGNSPKIRIIDFFLDNKLFDFTKKELVKELGMSYTTFYKIWDEFEKFGVVKVNRKIGKAKLYKLNKDNPIVTNILRLERNLIDQYAERVCQGEKINGLKIRKPLPA